MTKKQMFDELKQILEEWDFIRAKAIINKYIGEEKKEPKERKPVSHICLKCNKELDYIPQDFATCNECWGKA